MPLEIMHPIILPLEQARLIQKEEKLNSNLLKSAKKIDLVSHPARV